MNHSIMKAARGDLDAVKQLEIECDLSPWSVRDYAEELEREDSLFYVYREKENDQLLGFILARLIMTNDYCAQSSSEIEIYNIAVGKSSRHKRIGSKLVSLILNHRSVEKGGKVYLEVRKTNVDAQEFYKKNGFTIIGERKNFYTNPMEDAVLMGYLKNI